MKRIKLTAVVAVVLFIVACGNLKAPTPAPTVVQNTVVPIATARPTLVPSTASPIPVTLTPTPPPASRTLPPPATLTPVPPTSAILPTTAPSTVIPTPDFTKPLGDLTAQTNAGWQQFVASLQADDAARAQARADAFWELVKNRRVPLITADGVVFLYKGDAQSVSWRGDFNFYVSAGSILGKRINGTDLWYGIAKFPRDSRTEYQVVVNDSDGQLDPANPRTRKGGFGTNSVLTMPDFSVTDYTQTRADVPHGAVTDWITLDSKAWGASINYRVYTPPSYENGDRFPVLYVTDGNDFGDPGIGRMPAVLDNLIGDGKIAPVMAVFIDARNPADPSDNQREIQFLRRPDDFAAFITGELVPTIDGQYHTNAAREARALIGVSYGGAFTTYAGLKYPQVFGDLVIFSPAYWVYDSAGQAMGDFVRGTLAQKDGANPQKVFLSVGIPGWDVGDLKPWAALFRQHGASDVQIFHSQEGHSWGAWDGLMDEMLAYFFGG